MTLRPVYNAAEHAIDFIVAHDQATDFTEERSWYSTGLVPIRRDETSKEKWDRLPYRRLVGPWEPR